jgi:hypothetical protein
VLLDCIINADGSARCLVADESPENLGFGNSALRMAAKFHLAPSEATTGKRVSTAITFRLGS